jgi:hypothetical protein
MPSHYLANNSFLIVDAVYTLLVTIFCLIIYFKTKEAYSLTKHKGIKYFRNSFLFLGLAYISRLIFQIVLISGIFQGIITGRALFMITIALVGYFSTMAILLLILSSLWKKSKWFIVVFNVIAISVSMVTILTTSPLILVWTQLGLFLIAIILSLIFHSKSKKLTSIRIVYFLLFVFWLINMFFLQPRTFMPTELKSIIHLVSIAVFAIILYKVSKLIK